jgi:glycine cleavage system H protein
MPNHIPDQLRYTTNHEWACLEADGSVSVGITDHAQEVLGDLVYIELPEIGGHVLAQEEVAVVESVKAAADVYAPLSGVVSEVNQAVVAAPERINQQAYDSWLFKLKPDRPQDFDALADAATYQQMVAAANH